MQRSLIEFTALIVLVVAGAASRIWFRDLPNFAPIAAMALFAGYFFRTAWLAMLVPVAAMLVSDAFIGFYDWKLMAVVYGALTLPVALRPLLRHYLAIEPRRVRGVAQSLLGLMTCSLGCSLLFFAATNFACWYGSNWYPQTWQGLTACYVAAIPFFKYTLLGDLIFACLLFGGYALAINLLRQSSGGQDLAAANR